MTRKVCGDHPGAALGGHGFHRGEDSHGAERQLHPEGGTFFRGAQGAMSC
ncbi:MAG: hypothetical protein ABI193_20915 [Minicystis sp.]